MRLFLLGLLALNAGYVDAAGFLALHGLFTTHVTGNFVTLGASFAFGTTGFVAKLLALPTFCVVILLARTLGLALDRLGWPALRLTLFMQAMLLALGATLFLKLGPFPDGDAAPAVVTGLVVVSAMALQNALHRTRLSTLPPSTVLTGPIAQMMIDIADIGRGLPPEKREATRKRVGLTAIAVAAFAIGCAAAAFAYTYIHEYCFVAAPVIALTAFAATWAMKDEV